MIAAVLIAAAAFLLMWLRKAPWTAALLAVLAAGVALWHGADWSALAAGALLLSLPLLRGGDRP